MRVALCFSGLAERVLNHSNERFFQQLEKYNFPCDLFFSHWECGLTTEQFRNKLKIPESMSVKKIEFTPPFKWSSPYGQQHCWSQGNSPNGMFMMFGGIKNCDLLRQSYEKENSFIYDIVIRTRGDIGIKGDFDLPTYYKKISENPNLVLMPQNFTYRDSWGDQGIFCDQWFATTSDMMTKITTLVDHINEYTDSGSRFHPETLLWWHLTKTIKIDYELQNFRNIVRNVDDN